MFNNNYIPFIKHHSIFFSLNAPKTDLKKKPDAHQVERETREVTFNQNKTTLAHYSRALRGETATFVYTLEVLKHIKGSTL